MPTYLFIAKDGSQLEELHRITAIPKRIKRDGKIYHLAAFAPNPIAFNDGQVAATVHGYPRIDFTIPKGDVGGGVAPSGHAIIRSQHHERELMREHGLRRD